MLSFRHIISILALFFPIAWIVIFGQKDTLANAFLGLGGCISALFFYVWAWSDNKKTRTLTLQRIKERFNGETILISAQERLHLGPLMKDFVKQSGKIANATNNIDGLYLYKVSEKMKRRLERV